MALNLTILMAALAYFGATLTLPGIAGIILTIGVGIDSNVLIFERIREELKSGKAAVSAITTGFQRVFTTIVDTHLAALISAMFLFLFGTGPVKGFAVTLVIGLAANVFTAVFVSRTLFEWTMSRRERDVGMSI
jgi:preprotein translocase subunit SecD